MARQRLDREVEAATLAVLDVRLRRRAVDRERHLVDARVHEAPRLGFGQRQAVGAGVEVDVRKARLDVLAHLDRALVQKRFAVVEEVDPHQGRPRFVHDATEQVEVEHSGLSRPGDARSRGRSRPRCRRCCRPPCTRRTAATVTRRRRRSGRIPGSSFFSGSFSAQSPQNVEPPAFRSVRSAAITGPVQICRSDAARASPSTRCPYGSAQPQTIRPSHSMTSVVHGHEH